MSEENVEIMRQALEKWNRGDFDAVSELMDDDVVLRMAEGWPERVYFSDEDDTATGAVSGLPADLISRRSQ